MVCDVLAGKLGPSYQLQHLLKLSILLAIYQEASRSLYVRGGGGTKLLGV